MPETKVDARVLTQFGSTVLSLMAEKGVRTQSELVGLLHEEGLRVSQQGFAGWIYGKHGVAKEFPEALARALRLSESEKVRLALAFTYGQNKAVTLAQ